jgi:hypothetical protein
MFSDLSRHNRVVGSVRLTLMMAQTHRYKIRALQGVIVHADVWDGTDGDPITHRAFGLGAEETRTDIAQVLRVAPRSEATAEANVFHPEAVGNRLEIINLLAVERIA